MTGTLLRGAGFELLELDGEPEIIAMPEVEQTRLHGRTRGRARQGSWPVRWSTRNATWEPCGRAGGRSPGLCALCLRGGVPPLFLIGRPGEEGKAYLMVGWTIPELVDLAGRPVELAARSEWWDDLPVLRPADVRIRP